MEEVVGTAHEASPKGVGRFVLWLFVGLVVLLVILAALIYSQGHKSGIMRNSQITLPLVQPTGVVPAKV